MDTPTFTGAQQVAPDTTSFGSFVPLPMGLIPVNSFLINAREPLLVDTGVGAFQDEYFAAIEKSTDLSELKWIWVSHLDLDHVGNLKAVLAKAPKAKIVTTGFGTAKLGLFGIDPSRLHVVEAGQRLDLGDREMVALKPATYDAPETMGFFDTKTRVLFSVDAFAAVMEQPYENAAEIPADRLLEGMVTWANLDTPWLGLVDKQALGRVLTSIERLDPSAIISGHLPIAKNYTRQVLGHLMNVVSAGRVAAPDGSIVEELLKGRAAA